MAHDQPPESFVPGKPPQKPANILGVSEQISLKPAAPGTPGAPASPKPPARPVAKAPDEHKDSMRDTVETIVFVIVLVLLLKTFLAEAFVIPTGSMATTLLGYHKQANCEQCGYAFTVNASGEAEPSDGIPKPLFSGDCPNCGYRNQFRK